MMRRPAISPLFPYPPLSRWERLARPADASRELAGFHPAAVEHRHPGGVVSPVFQAAQALHQDRDCVPRADIPYDSAHRSGAPTLEFEQWVSRDRETEPSELGPRAVSRGSRRARQRPDRRAAPLARPDQTPSGARPAPQPLITSCLAVLAEHPRPPHVRSAALQV